jgi:ATP-dependent DNA helicase PIF1
MLNEMREGKLSQKSIAKFKTLNRELSFDDQLTATELFPTRFEVENANNLRMRQLQGETKTFEAKDSGSVTEKSFRDKLLANCMAVETLTLKKGAQVMLIKNIDETLVNGSLGKVIGFMSEQMFDNYQQHEEEYYAAQAEGVGEGAENEEEIPGLKERRQKMKDLMASTTQHFPVVRFTIADGSTRDLLCQREVWKVELPNGEVQASRAQIPLILAWALSIHKAQGQTLERVKVDLGRVFEKGQAYVALSRAVSMEGLQILNFNPSKVVAHERVRTFYNGLSRAEELVKAGSIRESVKETMNLGVKAKPKRKSNANQNYERKFVEDDWEL